MDTIFRKYRTKKDDVWQVGRDQNPLWTVAPEGGPPFRFWLAFCRAGTPARRRSPFRHETSPGSPWSARS